MAYTAPTIRVTGELITAAIWNADLTANLQYLAGMPSDAYQWTSNYTTTSTSFVDVDLTNLTLSLSSVTGRALVSLTASFEHTSGGIMVPFDVLVDGARQGSATTGLISPSVGNTSHRGNASFAALVTGLASGAHTFRLMWRTTSGTATLHAYGKFMVAEI